MISYNILIKLCNICTLLLAEDIERFPISKCIDSLLYESDLFILIHERTFWSKFRILTFICSSFTQIEVLRNISLIKLHFRKLMMSSRWPIQYSHSDGYLPSLNYLLINVCIVIIIVVPSEVKFYNALIVVVQWLEHLFRDLEAMGVSPTSLRPGDGGYEPYSCLDLFETWRP